MKVREPVARPTDVIAAELLVSASQSFLAGMLLYLAVGIWDERGVGSGPVAVILAGLGLAVGAGWLFWLMGGSGWPLAGANVPVSVFATFALVLGLGGASLLSLEPVPLLLIVVASAYGIVAGVFLDPPRAWRWDKRQRLRPGTEVARLSPATTAAVARMRRSRRTAYPSGTSVPPDRRAPPATASRPDPDGVVTLSAPSSDEADGDESPERSAGTRSETAAATRSSDPDAPLASSPAGDTTSAAASASAPSGSPLELPTSVEPKAQKSPWAWARPPEWNRNDDEDAAGGESSGS